MNPVAPQTNTFFFLDILKSLNKLLNDLTRRFSKGGVLCRYLGLVNVSSLVDVTSKPYNPRAETPAKSRSRILPAEATLNMPPRPFRRQCVTKAATSSCKT